MKKMLILGLAFSLIMMFSVGIMAETGPGFDEREFETGVGIFAGYDDANFDEIFISTRSVSHAHISNGGAVVVDGVTTSGSLSIPGDQEIKIEVPATAVIPCYLELELIGNAGYTKAKSIGSGAEGTVRHGSDSVLMLFDYQITGFMDEDWEFIDPEGGEFSSFGVNRGDRDPVYLHACDLYNANMYSNLPYGFQVSSTPLEGNEYGDILPMQMRYTFADSPGWTPTINVTNRSLDDGDDPANRLFKRNATVEESVFMQFRVPFNNVAADRYEGKVTFMVWTI